MSPSENHYERFFQFCATHPQARALVGTWIEEANFAIETLTDMERQLLEALGNPNMPLSTKLAVCELFGNLAVKLRNFRGVLETPVDLTYALGEQVKRDLAAADRADEHDGTSKPA